MSLILKCKIKECSLCKLSLFFFSPGCRNIVVLHRSVTHYYCHQVNQYLTSMDLFLSLTFFFHFTQNSLLLAFQLSYTPMHHACINTQSIKAAPSTFLSSLLVSQLLRTDRPRLSERRSLLNTEP